MALKLGKRGEMLAGIVVSVRVVEGKLIVAMHKLVGVGKHPYGVTPFPVVEEVKLAGFQRFVSRTDGFGNEEYCWF